MMAVPAPAPAAAAGGGALLDMRARRSVPRQARAQESCAARPSPAPPAAGRILPCPPRRRTVVAAGAGEPCEPNNRGARP